MLIAVFLLFARDFLELEVDFINTGLLPEMGLGAYGYTFCGPSCELPLHVNPCIACDSEHVLVVRVVDFKNLANGNIRNDLAFRLPALRVLDLHGNDLHSTVPSLPPLLQELDLRYNARLASVTSSLPLGLNTLCIERCNFSVIVDVLPVGPEAALENCTLVDLNATAGGANCFADLCEQLPSVPAACVWSRAGTPFEPCTPAFYAQCPHLYAPTTSSTAPSPPLPPSPPPPPPPLIAGQTMFAASSSADTIGASTSTLALVIMIGGALLLLVAALLAAFVGVVFRRRTRSRHRRQRRSTAATSSSHVASRPAYNAYSGNASRPVSEAVARVSYQAAAVPRRSRAISRARRDTTSGYDKAPSLSKLDRGYYDLPPASAATHTYDHAPSVASDYAGGVRATTRRLQWRRCRDKVFLA